MTEHDDTYLRRKVIVKPEYIEIVDVAIFGTNRSVVSIEDGNHGEPRTHVIKVR